MSGWTYSFEMSKKSRKCRKLKREFSLTLGWIWMMDGSGSTKFGTAELMVTSVWPLVASEAGYGDVPDETLFTFNFCC